MSSSLRAEVHYLADTHVLIWATTDPGRLPSAIGDILTDPRHTIGFSPVSLWEISIKFALGKLDLGGHTPDELAYVIRDSGFREYSVTSETFATSHRLPRRTEDPFDRLLIWQAIQAGTIFLTADHAVAQYVQDGLRLG
ncbi:MAG: type II toxin-antitoxin system VapC family toxin [Bifidobacteriaceae bacterium]|jgi:PIN domain nuclease of toxin-antitoxin system|nr:type II toxin-antitoxin system VapC family toxin [Bifidobacteriaceae bacterium]